MQKQQYLALTAALAVVLLLYFFGPIKQKSTSEVSNVEVQLDFSDYEQLQINQLPAQDRDLIDQLKNKTTLQPSYQNYLTLGKAWENIGNYPLGAYYYREAALSNSDSVRWEMVGDKLYNSYKNYGDSLITNNLVNFALASYEKAIEEDRNNMPLRMKLAEVYVEGLNPMKGVVMLREIVDSIPDYIPAQMSLGRLSLQSGQYDKALIRFEQVLEIDPVNTEAMYFLAISNEGLGNKEEAIRLLELCKTLVNIPEFTSEVDTYIRTLKN